MDAIADAHTNIKRVENMPVKLSKQLTHAIELFRAAEPPQEPALPDWASLKTSEVPAAYNAYLSELVSSSVVTAESNYFVGSLARYVNRCVNAEIPELTEQVRPEFNAAAERYRDAVEKLPRSINDSSLVQGGPEVLEAFQQAQAAAAEIKVFTDFVGRSGVDGDIALRATSPTTAQELQTVARAHKADNPTHAKLDPVLFAAVKNGVELSLNTKAQQKELHQHLTEQAKSESNQAKQQNRFMRGAYFAG